MPVFLELCFHRNPESRSRGLSCYSVAQPSLSTRNFLRGRGTMASADTQNGMTTMQQVAVTLRQLQAMQVRLPPCLRHLLRVPSNLRSTDYSLGNTFCTLRSLLAHWKGIGRFSVVERLRAVAYKWWVGLWLLERQVYGWQLRGCIPKRQGDYSALLSTALPIPLALLTWYSVSHPARL